MKISNTENNSLFLHVTVTSTSVSKTHPHYYEVVAALKYCLQHISITLKESVFIRLLLVIKYFSILVLLHLGFEYFLHHW